ncbi:hypothetical protein [Candidatus Odyssella thessalonicensis]|uniref:hypothetical protein n=1 Tax=Candidatus Odyssella thessalonicensis TaxID=84647 RepID=UPI001111C091|nr:hypothetical protein [Candidatus Odyssella thessalonicensis]
MTILALGTVLATEEDKKESESRGNTNTQTSVSYPRVQPRVEPLKELTPAQKEGLPPEGHPDRRELEEISKRDIPYFKALEDMGE